MCNMCKCCVKQSKYDLDRKIPLLGEGKNTYHYVGMVGITKWTVIAEYYFKLDNSKCAFFYLH